jgi:hypothetical protein
MVGRLLLDDPPGGIENDCGGRGVVHGLTTHYNAEQNNGADAVTRTRLCLASVRRAAHR